MTTENLRAVLKEIYGVEDKYLVHLNENIIAPCVDTFDSKDTYIGFDITSKKAYARAFTQKDWIGIPIKVTFRLAFVGKRGEELADETLFFPERADVISAFEKYNAQLDYEPRQIQTYHIHYNGYNDMNSFVSDMAVQTTVSKDMEHCLWQLVSEDIGGEWVASQGISKNRDNLILKG